MIAVFFSWYPTSFLPQGEAQCLPGDWAGGVEGKWLPWDLFRVSKFLTPSLREVRDPDESVRLYTQAVITAAESEAGSLAV